VDCSIWVCMSSSSSSTQNPFRHTRTTSDTRGQLVFQVAQTRTSETGTELPNQPPRKAGKWQTRACSGVVGGPGLDLNVRSILNFAEADIEERKGLDRHFGMITSPTS
jgi:hypothetical protein